MRDYMLIYNASSAGNAKSAPSLCLPAYPATSDIGYALWLRHFAAALPSYASHYGLTQEEIDAVRIDSLKYTAWLIRRMHRATQAIQQPCLASGTLQKVAATEAAAWQRLLRRTARLVRFIRAHPHYSISDGVSLKLNLSPAHACFGILPVPRLRVVTRQLGDNDVVVILEWEAYAEAIVHLQVCRDGYKWCSSLLVAGEHYVDIHPLTPEQSQWRYRARYQRSDWPNGPWSHTIVV